MNWLLEKLDSLAGSSRYFWPFVIFVYLLRLMFFGAGAAAMYLTFLWATTPPDYPKLCVKYSIEAAGYNACQKSSKGECQLSDYELFDLRKLQKKSIFACGQSDAKDIWEAFERAQGRAKPQVQPQKPPRVQKEDEIGS